MGGICSCLALTDHPTERVSKRAKAIDREDAIRERPLGFKSFEENSDGWVDCDHVFGLRRGIMTAGPDGIRDPVPNNQAASRPLVPTGFPDRRFDRSSSLSALAPWHPRAAQAATGCGRLPHHASSWPLPALPVGLSGWSITAETPWGFDRLKLREIEFDNRL
jgi:hypothetical protein